jgi:choline-sulfatase
LNNLASLKEYSGIASEFESCVRQKWNERELTERILLSQKRRKLILTALRHGEASRWNHGENPGDKVLWYRGQGSYNQWAFSYLPEREREIG